MDGGRAELLGGNLTSLRDGESDNESRIGQNTRDIARRDRPNNFAGVKCVTQLCKDFKMLDVKSLWRPGSHATNSLLSRAS